MGSVEISSFISDISYFSPLSFFFLNLSGGLTIFLKFSKNQLLDFFFIFLFWFIIFNLFLNSCSDYYLFSFTVFLFTFPPPFCLPPTLSFHSLLLSLFPSPASSFIFLKWKHILLILDLSSFPTCAFNATKFSPCTAFAAAHRFW